MARETDRTANQALGPEGHPQKIMGRMAQFLNTSLVAAALVALVVIFGVTAPSFFSSTNVPTIFDSVAVIAVLSVGQAFVIITAGIDLSQGSVVALAGVIGASIMAAHGVFVGAILMVVIGALVGLFNGVLVAYTRVPAFIVTLGSLSMAAGAALLYTGGEPIYNLPSSLVNFGNGAFLYGLLPYIIIISIVAAIVGQIVLGRTRFGRSVYAIGSNRKAALLSGVRVPRVTVLVYVISGFLSGLGALMLTAYVNTADPGAGTNFELDAIAAVVIGGGSLFGGQGSVWSAALGALLLSVLANGTQLLGVSSYAQTLILGIVVIGAVFIDSFRKRSAV
ncbi:MAG: sugar ABC transporter permease [Sulfobacillus acidophilus]|uniref:Sugar ABC transporter permease n=1 Tax=Sulfobacillus acidophilus TaxID=53633 RepID=A0A2T2WCH5_9FIRM|nr:MAG: sugar ABC transporter permease [Sulfobacillus acidophilus]